jgi:hypothetical protein
MSLDRGQLQANAGKMLKPSGSIRRNDHYIVELHPFYTTELGLRKVAISYKFWREPGFSMFSLPARYLNHII